MTTILDMLILFLITPPGFVVLVLSLIYVEYVIAKSIIKDTDMKRVQLIFKKKKISIKVKEVLHRVGIPLHIKA